MPTRYLDDLSRKHLRLLGLPFVNAIDQEGQNINANEDIYYRLRHFKYSSSRTNTFSILPTYMVWKSRCG